MILLRTPMILLHLFVCYCCIILTCKHYSQIVVDSLSLQSNNVQITSSRRESLSLLTSAFVLTNSPHFAYSEIPDDNKNSNVITTNRGLKYIVTKQPNDATSPTPERGQKVKASYTLYLNGFPTDDGNNEQFSSASSVKVDSSKGFLGDRPFEFLAGVSQVIKGWDLAIMDMRVGEARKLIVNSDLGYGDKGAGGRIPGGATLYFDIELNEIGPKAKIGPEQIKWLEDNPL